MRCRTESQGVTLPGAEHVVVKDSGHLLMLEHPRIVTMHLVDLVERSLRSQGASSREQRRAVATRRTVTHVRRRGRRRDPSGRSEERL